MKLTGENRNTRGGGETCPSATLSTTDPTWTYLRSNPVLRGERPATNRLNHGTALYHYLLTRGPNKNSKYKKYKNFNKLTKTQPTYIC
jgi:hypothetical protein